MSVFTQKTLKYIKTDDVAFKINDAARDYAVGLKTAYTALNRALEEARTLGADKAEIGTPERTAYEDVVLAISKFKRFSGDMRAIYTGIPAL